jgi:hypothetical protein
MLKGVHLTLMIGPAVPVPVPQSILDALTSVEVNCYSGGTPGGFSLKFTLSNQSPLHTLFVVSGGVSIPIIRVVIIATVNGSADVLMDGVMTTHEISPGQDGTSTLEIKGKDLTSLMDIIPFDAIPYPAMPVYARVNLILAKYLVFGIAPVVIPPIFPSVPIPTEQIPAHIGTDLDYLKRLAQEVGYIFYISPGPVPLTNIAYFGPEVKVGIPQPALNVNMDAHTNVESLTFGLDKETKEIPLVYLQLPIAKVPIPVPIPDITPLNPPLGLVPPLPVTIRKMKDTANLPALDAVLKGLAYAVQHSDAVTGTGTLNVTRYGRILKARQLVGVRGAGQAFDGLYYVKSVTHTIKRGEYKQNFTLSRNGLISTVPEVPV